MIDFDEMVAFLLQECVNWQLVNGIDWNVRRYRLKARFGLTKDFYVDFDKKKCSMWHSELSAEYSKFPLTRMEMKNSDFKTHVEVQKELDRIL